MGQGQTQIKHERDDGDDRDRARMADDAANDSQALTGGDIARYRTLVAHQCRYVVCDGKDISARHGARQQDRKIPRWEDESKVMVPLAAEW